MPVGDVVVADVEPEMSNQVTQVFARREAEVKQLIDVDAVQSAAEVEWNFWTKRSMIPALTAGPAMSVAKTYDLGNECSSSDTSR